MTLVWNPWAAAILALGVFLAMVGLAVAVFRAGPGHLHERAVPLSPSEASPVTGTLSFRFDERVVAAAVEVGSMTPCGEASLAHIGHGQSIPQPGALRMRRLVEAEAGSP